MFEFSARLFWRPVPKSGSGAPWVLWAAFAALLIGRLLLSQGQFQVGYAILSPPQGGRSPVAAALFSYRNPNGVLVAEAGVGAVRPAASGRIFVDQRGTRTGIAFANPADATANLRLTLRDAQGGGAVTRDLRLGPREHLPQFVDELFAPLPSDFVGTLTYQVEAGEVAAVTLRQSLNSHGEPLLATLPVAGLVSANQPAGSAPTERTIPHLGAGGGLTTQIILIERSGGPVSGVIRLRGRDGSALSAELDGVQGSEFPFQLPANGVFVGVLDSSSGISQGWGVVRVEAGQMPAGVAVFQFRDRLGKVVSEAGIGFAEATGTARIFVDEVGTRTGVALAAPGGAVSVTFRLLDRNGFALRETSRHLPAGGQTALFVDELFSDLPFAFTGLLEVAAAEPFAPTSLKFSVNQRGEPILTTLPVADLDRPFPDSTLIFPQIGFGVGFSTRIVLINPDSATSASLAFRSSGGGDLAVPLGGGFGASFDLPLVAGGSSQLRPGNSASPASLLIDPSRLEGFEIAVNRGGEVIVRPIVIDQAGEPRDDFEIHLSSLDPEIATVDALGRIDGLRAGFSTLTAEVGGIVGVTTITVVDVSPGTAALEIDGLALDPAGRLFLANSASNTVLRSEGLTATPQVYAGRTGVAGLLNGSRLDSLFSEPRQLALNRADGSLFVADSRNHVIRRILPGGNDAVETFAGSGVPGYDDGPGSQASFFDPFGVALDQHGQLWVADTSNHLIRRINSTNRTVETIAGLPGVPGSADGSGGEARFNRPAAIAVEPEPLNRQLERLFEGTPPPPVSVIVVDSGNGILRRVREDGLVETVGESLAHPSSRGRIPSGAGVSVGAVAVDGFGNIFQAGPGGVTVLLPDGALVDAAQEGTFANPRALAISAEGSLVVADGDGTLRLEYGAPAIDAIEPDAVSNRAGSRVEIRGRNFSADTIVVVAGREVEYTVTDSRTIDLRLPALPSGRTTVTVQNRGGAAQAPLFVSPTPLAELEAGYITTVVGGGTFIGDGGAALDAKLFNPEELAVDPAGNLFIADRDNHRVRRVDVRTGIITTIAGTGRELMGPPRNDVPAVTAELRFPEKLAVDGAGNVYISSFLGTGGLRVVESATGLIRSVPNLRTLGGFHQIVADASGNLFISKSFENQVVRRDAVTGEIAPYAGNGGAGFSGDGGPALQASLNSPQRMAIDSAGNLYIADQQNNRIRKVDAATGRISTVAVVNAGFGPENVALDAAGNLFVGGTGFFGLIRIDAATGQSSTLIPTIDSQFLAVDSGGNVFYTDQPANQVSLISSQGERRLVAGTGASSEVGDGGPAAAAALTAPVGIATAANGDLYVADRYGQRIRRVEASTGLISTVAGTGDIGNFEPVDGTPAVQARLFFPSEVAVDGEGTVYFADSKIWRIDPVGALRTVTRASNPNGLELDSAGSLYFSAGNRVMRWDRGTASLTTIAGSGQAGYSGDGGPAVSATLNVPSGLALDSNGNIYIADSFNGRVRRVDGASGIITTVAGGGGAPVADNRPAIEVMLSLPTDVAVDGEGDLYILQPFAIRRVNAATQTIATIAKSRSFASEGDNGPATEASFDGAQIAVGADGNIYLTDASNGRVRAIKRP